MTEHLGSLDRKLASLQNSPSQLSPDQSFSDKSEFTQIEAYACTKDEEGETTLCHTPTTPSRCGTPSEASRPQNNRRESSMIQVGTEEKKTWYRYPRRGYQVTTKYFYQEIDSSWTAVLLVACFFVSGLVDSVAFSVWNVFVAMQTGNTIFMALRISGQPVAHHPLNFIKCMTSVISYCAGALVFNCLHRAPTELSDLRPPLHRWTLLTSFAIQSSLIVGAAILAQVSVLSTERFRGGTFSSGSVTTPGDNYLDLIGIALLAFEAAGQVCLSRVLAVNELPTIVLSTLYHDLVSEALSVRKNWRQSNTCWDFVVTQKKQIRRLSCIISLFAGALVGGFVFESKGGLAAALWLAGGVKICIAIAWCLWKKKMVTETVVEEGISNAPKIRDMK